MYFSKKRQESQYDWSAVNKEESVKGVVSEIQRIRDGTS